MAATGPDPSSSSPGTLVPTAASGRSTRQITESQSPGQSPGSQVPLSDEGVRTGRTGSSVEAQQYPAEGAETNGTAASSAGPETTTADPHFERLEDFAQDVTSAAKSILGARAEVTRVVVFIAYWKEARYLKHMRANAQDLRTFFKDRCGFEGDGYQIPCNADLRARDFEDAIAKEHDKIRQDKNALFIMYYGGHAAEPIEGDGKRKWMAEDNKYSPYLMWDRVFPNVFEKSTCRKIFILDCCYAGAMINARDIEWQGTCEVFGASSAVEKAIALEKSSFTKAILTELENRTYTIHRLHCKLNELDVMRDYELKVAPYYNDWAAGSKVSSVIRRNDDKTKSARTTDETPSETWQALRTMTTRVLIKVSFNGTAASFLKQYEQMKDDWRNWMNDTPEHIKSLVMKAAEDCQMLGLFDSNSCTTIWSMPLWLWSTMAPSASCQYLGIIRSDNYLQQPQLASTQKVTEHAKVPVSPIPSFDQKPSIASRWVNKLSPPFISPDYTVNWGQFQYTAAEEVSLGIAQPLQSIDTLHPRRRNKEAPRLQAVKDASYTGPQSHPTTGASFEATVASSHPDRLESGDEVPEFSGQHFRDSVQDAQSKHVHMKVAKAYPWLSRECKKAESLPSPSRGFALVI